MSAGLNVTATIAKPTVRIGAGEGQPLPSQAESMLLRTVVDCHLHLPGMFEMTFFDSGCNLLASAGIKIGTRLRVLGYALGGSTNQVLIDGEVTGLEASCRNLNRYTTVRGYDLCHRMQRARRTRTFRNITDSEIAGQIAKAAGFTEPPPQIEPTTVEYPFVGQCNQTDWEFLGQRATEIGYDVGVSAGTFYFRKAASLSTPSGDPVPLAFPDSDLRRFSPRVTSGNIAPKVEVRVWDPLQAKIIGDDQSASTGTAQLTGTEPAALAGTFVKESPPASTVQPGSPVVPNLGPAPDATAYVIYDRPVATGAAINAAAPAAAKSLADHVASTFAEAEGEAKGNPAIQPGAALSVTGVPAPFCGSWLVTNARHVFDLDEGGYTTYFVVSGRQDRSLLSLAAHGGTRPRPASIPGVCCGVVTNNNDPQKKGQVRVILPSLSPDYETDWAPVIQFGAGKLSGAMFLPEVGDQVLVGFEFGDPRRPYVLGGILTSASAYSLGGDAIKVQGETGTVALRGFVSAAGNRLVFADQLPPGGASGPPEVSTVTLGTGDGNLTLAIDQVNGTITLNCKPAPPGSKQAKGTISIQCGDAGTINIAAGSGGTMNIDGGANLNLKAQSSISIQSQAEVTIKGSKIALSGTSITLN
ncbi:MAG TPA: phage baseplate assembly protein V [Streptosporangiaceae bacterium]|jgi:phage protein D|nr:phage baseplate assembly protein V [Streptosporangiaceae bacterium]